jgi:TetR/AcrR family transcriptional regulator, cholesterol catabolism regulator
MTERATTEPQSRRDQILLTAAELFARKGVGATTVREIADSVGVLSGSLYHHFESKDAIVDEVLGRYLGTLRERYGETLAQGTSAADRLRRLVLTSVQVAEEQPYATTIYQNELHYLREQPRFKQVQAAAADVQKTWLAVIESGVADGEFRSDIEPRVFYRLIRDSLWLSVRWHRPGPGYPAETLAGDITSIFLNGYVARRDAKPRPPHARTAGDGSRRPAKKA